MRAAPPLRRSPAQGKADKIMKKYISILLVMTFLLSVLSVGTVFAYEAETYPDDTFADNVVIEDYVTAATSANADLVINGNAMTFTPKKTTGTTNNQYGDTIDGKDWQNTGRVEVYYTVSYEGELASGDTYGMGIGLTAFNGTSRAWILGGVASYSGFKFESGVTKNIKHVVEFTDEQTIVTSYTKSPDEDEWTYAFTVTNDFAAAPNKRHLREILPFSQHNFNKGTEYVSTTISDVRVVETIVSPLMTEVSGNYLGLDDIDVSYYIPKDYKAATLSFNGEGLKVFDPEIDDFGSYNTYFNLMQFDVVGENIPLKLEVTLADDSVADVTEYITVTEPILEASFEDVSGTYNTSKTVTVNYEIPHIYSGATLTYNDEVIASYNSGENGGGPYSAEIILADWGFVGEDLPIVFTVSYDDKEDDVFTSLITVTESFPEAKLSRVGGAYLMYDDISADYILPDDYTTASLTFGDYVLSEHNGAEDKSGRYSLDFNLYDMEMIGEDIPLVLTIDGKEAKKELIDVVEVMNVNEILTEDFEDENYSMVNDLNQAFAPEQIDKHTFDSKVFKHTFNTTNFARAQIIKGGLSISSGVIMEVSYDVNVANKKFNGGLHSKYTNSAWYSAQRFQRDGKFMDIMEYETDKWYNVTYRVMPDSVTDSGKHEIYLYVDGVFVGKTETVYTQGFAQIGIDYENGYGLGDLYVDNIRMVTYSPMFDLKVEDENSGIDYQNPEIKTVFDQKMDGATINSDNIKLISFNGAEVKCTLSYNEENRTLTIVPEENLVAGKTYEIVMSADVMTSYGSYFEKGTKTLVTTKKAPFAIESIDIPDISANNEFDVTVNLTNADGSKQTGKVYAALYVDGKLESVAGKDVSGEYTSKGFDVTLKAPSDVKGEVKVIAYLTKGLDSFAVIDWIEN